ncbi:MAG: hypothetical protein DI537_47125 [Stutzerimonas stutzeri]|nr:MAG: hypothetical protein DI537_47125 [Stutzerimonas stutzeri]
MIIRDYIAAIRDDERDELLSLYNLRNDPEIDRPKLDSFITQLLAIEVVAGEDDIFAFTKRHNPTDFIVEIAGEGWGHYDGAEWTYMANWDVEWRPASEVLGLEMHDRLGLSRLELTMWILEELGVYLPEPRKDIR